MFNSRCLCICLLVFATIAYETSALSLRSALGGPSDSVEEVNLLDMMATLQNLQRLRELDEYGANDLDKRGDLTSEDSFPELSHVMQKRHFCIKYFVYNPVRGRCQPTLLALRKGRAGGYIRG